MSDRIFTRLTDKDACAGKRVARVHEIPGPEGYVFVFEDDTYLAVMKFHDRYNDQDEVRIAGPCPYDDRDLSLDDKIRAGVANPEDHAEAARHKAAAEQRRREWERSEYERLKREFEGPPQP